MVAGLSGYAANAPYSPDQAWPEYPFDSSTIAKTPNPAYEGVRRALALLNLDAAHLDTKEWNPLGEIVTPGDTVVLKPNFVREFRESHVDHADCVITHGSILRAVADYVFIALKGSGRLIIADAPHNDADFDAIAAIAGLNQLQDFYRKHAGMEVEVYDLRPERAEKMDGVIVGHRPLPGDPAGYVKVDVGRHSAFMEVLGLCHLLYGSEYDMKELYEHQHGDIHEYMISKTILDADVVISLPKLKTHKKVGLTVNMKNLVGINGNKNWLPHHREGTPAAGGDQFPDNRMSRRIERHAVACFKRVFPMLGPVRRMVARPIKGIGKRVFGDTNGGTIRSGNWHGNDTTWRMVLDLNRILYYADAEGRLHDTPQRRLFSFVDGIVAGEGNGPLDPVAKRAGLVLCGGNPIAVDFVCCRVMGFDHLRVPLLREALADHSMPFVDFSRDDISVRSDDQALDGLLGTYVSDGAAFEPHFGWKGHVELETLRCAD